MEEKNFKINIMKLFYRYIAKKFWGPFFFGLSIFAVLVFLADLFDHLKYFINTTAPLIETIKYFLFIIPFWVLITLPVAGLLASLFVLSDMVTHGEWTAALASGYSKRQVYIPIVLCICMVSGVNFILQETASPLLHKKAKYIFRIKIKGKSAKAAIIKENIVVKTSENSFLTAKVLDLKNKSMERIILYDYSEGKIVSQIDAQKALWDENLSKWIFYDLVVRKFKQKASVREKNIARQVSDLDISPENLLIEKVWPEDLTIRDILKRIKALKRVELPVGREITYLHTKLAFPFVSIIMCILAFPFATTVKKGGKMVHFGLAILVAFFFWWIISVFQSAGEAGMLNPILAGWVPVAVFSLISFLGLKFTAG